MHNWKHILMIMAGCLLPLIFIIIAPLLGIRGQWSTAIFFISMLACHLLMPMHHHNHPKKDNNESHSH